MLYFYYVWDLNAFALWMIGLLLAEERFQHVADGLFQQ